MTSLKTALLVTISVGIGALCAPEARADEWLAPNEHFPIFGDCVYESVPPGLAYISVGSERGFMGAARTASAALFVADIDPDVIRFAQINRALIAISADADEYRHFRLEATGAEWDAAAAKLIGADLIYKAALNDRSAWGWWNTEVRKSIDWENGFPLLAAHPIPNPDPGKNAFTGFNYLWDENLFQNLKTIVTNHQIWAEYPVNLTHMGDLQKMLTVIQNSFHTQIGMVDTSNVQDEWQAGVAPTAAYYAFLAGNSPPYAVLMNTEAAAGTYWSYFGFTAQKINQLKYSEIEDLLSGAIQSLRAFAQDENYKCQFNGHDVGPVWHEIPQRLPDQE